MNYHESDALNFTKHHITCDVTSYVTNLVTLCSCLNSVILPLLKTEDVTNAMLQS